nr:hypothetical protein [Microbacterium sp. Mcb102]
MERKTLGWGVDPTRITTNMTSSQALLFNLFGEFGGDMEWAVRATNLWLGRTDAQSVKAIHLEYAPRRLSTYLNDHTIVDALVEVESEAGPELIAFELKFADRFSSRRVPFDRNPRYQELARTRAPWRAPLNRLVTPQLNQLTRVHALTERSAEVLHPDKDVRCTLLVACHPDDVSAGSHVESYRGTLSRSDSVHLVTLDALINAMESSGPSSSSVQQLRARYLP